MSFTDRRLLRQARKNGHPFALSWYQTHRERPLKVIRCLVCDATIGSYSSRFFRPAEADFAIAEHGETHL